ncbi:Hypothetical_protein [Hexamita inflata]|uniref:Hypothetical_protein n=1 Tax=Hexamita inflata TaxID=28002 RepID=A0AA86QAG8_9EUKA|nr:Hypothetical protein HINF_LOCUS36952 [Hexamita inflata]
MAQCTVGNQQLCGNAHGWELLQNLQPAGVRGNGQHWIRWSGEARLMLLRSDGSRQFGADKGGDVYAELEGLRPRTVWPQNPNMQAGSKARITRKGSPINGIKDSE